MSDAQTPKPRRARLFGRAPLAFDPSAPVDNAALLGQAPTLEEWEAAHADVSSPSTSKNPLSVLSSAARITGQHVKSSAFRKSTHEEWQDDGWSMYDLVGELRFAATTLAQRTSKARLFVGKIGQGPNEGPALVTDPRVAGILDAIGDGHLGMSRLIERLAVNLFLAGDGWLVGIPKELVKKSQERAASGDPDSTAPISRTIDRTPGASAEKTQLQTLDDLDWRMLSIAEAQILPDDLVQLKMGPANSESLKVSPDDVFMVRVWRSHPRNWWQADSPTRSSLPVLRELVGLTMHISAQVDSRLAGAGLLIVPSSASRAMKLQAGLTEDSEQDPFTDGLIDAMLTPIGDRSNASALVPLVITVPDESAKLFEFMSFDKPLDSEAKELRNEAIRRLALGLDMPPELLLGTSDSNHWSAWLQAEEVVSSHIEPPLQLICDALTMQYLRPMLIENGFSEEEAEKLVVWYDVSELITRPNKSTDAQTLYNMGELSGKTLRAANGFDETDAPDDADEDPAVQAVFEMVKTNPGLMLRPGLDVMLKQVKALLSGNPLESINARDEKNDEKVVGVEEPEVAQPALPPVGTPVGAAAPAAIETRNAPGAPPAGPIGAVPAAAPVAAAVDASAFRVDPSLDGVYEGAHIFPELRGSLSKALGHETDDDIVDLTGL
jgi:hypothetical protein